MKYMIMTFGDQTELADKPQGWTDDLIEFMFGLDEELHDSGQLVLEEGLVDPSRAKTVVPQEETGVPIAEEGPLGQVHESLAGFWIVDVPSEARAIQIASRIVDFVQEPIEVRRIAEGPTT